MARFCTNCGARLADGAMFCRSCGQPVDCQDESDAVGRDARPTDHDVTQRISRPLEASAPRDVENTAPVPVVSTTGFRPAGVSAAGGSETASSQGDRSSHGSRVSPLLIVVLVLAIIAVVVAAVAVTLAIVRPGGQAPTPAASTAAASTEAPSTQAASPAAPSVIVVPATPQSSMPTSPVTPSSTVDYVLPDSSSQVYGTGELSSLSDWQLTIARNEIYARYGRGFNDADIRRYFEGEPWYHERYSADQFDAMPDPLNSVEKTNVTNIQSVENSRK